MVKMKATELRLGNYYQCINDNGLYYDKVQEIKCNQFGLLSNYDGTNYEICEPIILTKEWLLFFGFRFTILSDFTFNDFRIIDGGNCFQLLKGDDLINIQYVHQLQNLYFALTNEELIFKQR
jgi:hypothetical protein